MARGGINKALVSNARETLISRGENPSIDAIRVELGNTGSKSTIHRYLREIEEEASARLDDETLLSQPIKELVGRLASVLRQEAQSLVEEHQTKHQNQVRSLTDRLQELENSLANTNNTLEAKERELKVVLSDLDASKASEETLKANASKANQANEKLQVLLAEKQAQNESLEEKHRHNREAMEHYRQSVKDQREQDQRKHEHQVQQLQAEIRALNQTLSVKQGDITQLNKDNGRLVAELGATQKTLAKIEDEQRKLTTNLDLKTEETDSLQTQLSELKDQSEEIDKLKKLNEELLAWKAEALVSIGKLETEISIKTDMMNRLLAEKSKTPEASE
ncbi:DNA-binding protein [Spongiibacter sp. KMU-158]|uniref:DNA-binding protein n=1 Tax=Spongiibacter pelagi TaxID=2760804 RepID=A0A927C461_9GAMM|nr:DNA-binding protein [Spongiibacter pelagi]MBD2859271.1 DNA-binding protein [Spongiibacter pelagi]